MASVWLAELSKPDRRRLMLLKTVRPRSEDDVALAESFLAEASLAAQLTHPNVMEVVDFGQLDGRSFLATEFLPGRTLRQIDRRARKANQQLELWFLVRVAIDVCAALSYVHTFEGRSGKVPVRLEVRPENITVAFNGTVKLLDLGFNPSITDPARPDTPGRSRYLAPEREEASEATPASDVYALGVVLYEYATGVFPFDEVPVSRSGPQSTTLSPPPPSVHNPGVPGHLSDIILRAIDVDPAARYSSPTTLARALIGYLAQVDPESLSSSLEPYVTGLFPHEGKAKTTTLSGIQKAVPTPPVPGGAESAARLPPKIPPVSKSTAWTNGAPIRIPALVALSAKSLQNGRSSSTPTPSAPRRMPEGGSSAETSAAPRRVTLSMTGKARTESGALPVVEEVAPAQPSSSAADAAVAAFWDEPKTQRSVPFAAPRLEGPLPPLEAPVAPPEPSPRPSADASKPVPAPPKALFPSWRASRSQAFSMATLAPREKGASPPLGSVFSTRKATEPVPPPPIASLSPEAKQALVAFDRGLELVHHKDHQRALEAWREAVALDPSNRTYQANLKRLERLIASNPG